MSHFLGFQRLGRKFSIADCPTLQTIPEELCLLHSSSYSGALKLPVWRIWSSPSLTCGMFIENGILLSVRVNENIVHAGGGSAASIYVLRIWVAIGTPRIAVATPTTALERGQIVRIQGRVEVMVVVRVRG